MPDRMFAQDTARARWRAAELTLGQVGKKPFFSPKFPAGLIRNAQGCSRAGIPAPADGAGWRESKVSPLHDLRPSKGGDSSRLVPALNYPPR